MIRMRPAADMAMGQVVRREGAVPCRHVVGHHPIALTAEELRAHFLERRGISMLPSVSPSTSMLSASRRNSVLEEMTPS